jgi:hypothetical protein
MNGMIMHCGAEYATIDDLYNVPVAPGSDTYCPVAHGVVRDRLVESIKGRGLAILNERWALSDARRSNQNGKLVRVNESDPTIYTGDGSRAFGLLEVGGVRPDHTDYNFMIGIRNSQDKTLALGLAVGARVFICDNMALSGESIFYRKHTSGFNLIEETERALFLALKSGSAFFGFFEALKQAPVDNSVFEGILCDSLRSELLPSASARHMLEAWYDGKAPANRPDFGQRLADGVYQDRNAWTVHNLWTDLVGHERNLTAMGSGLLSEHTRLNSVIRNRLPMLPSPVDVTAN